MARDRGKYKTTTITLDEDLYSSVYADALLSKRSVSAQIEFILSENYGKEGGK